VTYTTAPSSRRRLMNWGVPVPVVATTINGTRRGRLMPQGCQPTVAGDIAQGDRRVAFLRPVGQVARRVAACGIGMVAFLLGTVTRLATCWTEAAVMIEVVVDSIRGRALSPDRLLVLKERDGPRVLVMGIGPLEAEAIAIRVQRVGLARPLIHDLFAAVLEAFGATIRRVDIPEIKDHAFQGRLVLERDGAELILDARPSDAIALALRAQAPIYAAANILIDVTAVDENAAKTAPVEDSKLDIFKDFIDSLDTDDVART
jgi:uncharacterized protein